MAAGLNEASLWSFCLNRQRVARIPDFVPSTPHSVSDYREEPSCQ